MRPSRGIEEAPQRWPEIEPGFRRYLVDRFPYALIDRVRPDAVEILVVMHVSRRPGYWRNRVR